MRHLLYPAVVTVATLVSSASLSFAQPSTRSTPPTTSVTAPASGPAPVADTEDDDEPALPAGLDTEDGDEPALPAGLGDDDDEAGDEPALPAGLGGEDDVEPSAAPDPGIPLEWRLLADLRAGSRLLDDPVQDRLSLAELRLQIDLKKSWRPWSTSARLVVDLVGDPLADEQLPDLERGQGAIDLRAASLTFSPTTYLDLRLGRQVLTWGTGDLLFINDLFPKDWTAFLLGRDVEYLKAPSDAAKLAFFTDWVGLDLVLTPRFDPDRLPVRDRLSSWDPGLGRLAGSADPILVDLPDRWGRDGEVAARLHRRLGVWELAGYGYYGQWKSPAGFDPATGAATFPQLAVYGASVRGPVAGGIAHAEVGFFDALDDRSGDDPTLRNSEARGLIGFERQLSMSLTASVQYYAEAMMDHDGYRAGLLAGAPVADQLRQLVTARLRYLSRSQRLMGSVFIFASPTDRDGYVRPSASYALDDHWTAAAGANLFYGREQYTFFGQLENNSNAYLALRYAR